MAASKRPSAPPSGAKKKRRPSLVLPPQGALPLGAPLAYSGALLSGLLYWLAFAGMDVWPLAFVAFVPLWVAMHRQTARRATALGLVSGLTMNVCGFSWLAEMLKVFSGFPTALCLLFVVIVCAYQGGRLALLGWLYARATARGWPGSLMFLLAFAASELLYPLLFPWYYAATVHQIPLLTQTGELGGPILVGLVLVGANLAIAEPLLARLERRALDRHVVLGGVIGVVVAAAFGAWRIRATDSRAAESPEVKIGMVQANMGLMEKRQDPYEGLNRHLHATTKLREQGADFVVWSETSAMRPLLETEKDRAIPREIGRLLGMPAIFGAVLVKPDPDPRRRYVYFNTAISTDARGDVNGRYDKEFLLAFGEYLPFGDTFPALYEASPHSGRFSAGTELTALTIDLGGTKHAIAMLICYEDILPSFTNRVVAATKPELLVNMTNDAWFGDTSEPWEHLALAQLRAVEHRRYLVRSTNSGVSAVVDPVGRVIAKTSPFKEETILASVRWMKSSTVYESLGDVPWYAASIVAFAAAFVRRKQPLVAASPS
jgi:apolipoprotein N-acyltransferase